ncbi:P44/Msp2 family outer membrane protein [Anaplasma marginale]|uniref:P44/Msp2 family outer membrane protein n=1 Tax=Anaplasma marginale TaxID=770 RepID=A0A643CLZ0_ANAMA|nr:P44/Msp2 family outer membrane protein [Anaplasma marginale]KAA8474481.1 P44/Msp2 family outer membrane protein [Anaplasma marginale]KAB0452228.1 P44/Msp2 family outer membrane protein [Anaplasma marginale]RCL19843.1 P44/Msp2 family outer membrane protein [Anaplasma marginale]
MKKVYGLVYAALSLLFTPCGSFASPRPIDFSRGEGASGFFASVQYKLAVPHFRDFIVEDKGKALNTFAMKEKQQGGTAKAATGAATPPAASSDAEAPPAKGPDLASGGSFEGKYSPEYLRSAKAGSVSVGYSAGNVRLEAEGMYQKFPVDTKKYKDNPERAYRFAISAPDENSTTVATRPQEPYHITAENKEVTTASLMANLCYDLLPESSQISPSACVGGGGSLVRFLGVTEVRWAYQAKVGVQYFASRKAALFAYAYASRVHPEKFSNIPVVHHIKTESPKGSQGAAGGGGGEGNAQAAGGKLPGLLYPQASLGLDYFGFECGIRLVL